jgi:hypothetical protein
MFYNKNTHCKQCKEKESLENRDHRIRPSPPWHPIERTNTRNIMPISLSLDDNFGGDRLHAKSSIDRLPLRPIVFHETEVKH